MVDYKFSGLDSMTLDLVLTGSSHFMNNLDPSFYAISDITLFDGEVNISFSPTENLPKEMRVQHYSISVKPHEMFGLVVKDATKDVVKYAFLNCRLDKDGKLFFHFDMLSKKCDSSTDEQLHFDEMKPIKELIENGYIREKSYDDKKLPFVAVTLYEKKAS